MMRVLALSVCVRVWAFFFSLDQVALFFAHIVTIKSHTMRWKTAWLEERILKVKDI